MIPSIVQSSFDFKQQTSALYQRAAQKVPLRRGGSAMKSGGDDRQIFSLFLDHRWSSTINFWFCNFSFPSSLLEIIKPLLWLQISWVNDEQCRDTAAYDHADRQNWSFGNMRTADQPTNGSVKVVAQHETSSILILLIASFRVAHQN